MNPLNAELRKLLTLPSLRLTALLTLAATVLLEWVSDQEVLGYAQCGFLVLGVLAAASEHQAGGQFRTTLLAVPRRGALYAAKLATLTAATLPVALLAGRSATAYLLLTTLLAFAVATVARHAVPALLPLLGLYFVAGPVLRAARPGAGAYLPDTAAWTGGRGLTTTVAWTLAALAVAAWTFRRRDA